MKYLFLEYPRCSTCRKAKSWLSENNVEFYDRNIVEENPSFEELENWIKLSGLDIKKFFNTSGLVYKEMNLKDKLDDMSDKEKIELLATNGKLVKRPLLISENSVLVGFKEEKWKENLKNS